MKWIDGLFEKANAPENLEKLLIHYGVRFRSGVVQLSNLRCPLPVHPPNSEDSLSVNFVKGEWKCWNTKCAAFREGQRLGNPLGFVISMEGCSPAQAAQKILEWFGAEVPKKQKPPLKTEAFAKNSTDLENQNSTEIPQIQGKSEPKRVIGFQPPPEIGEKIPAEPEMRSSGGAGREPVPQNPTAIAEPVKGRGFMHEAGIWLDGVLVVVENERKRKEVKKSIMDKIHESYKNGKAAR